MDKVDKCNLYKLTGGYTLKSYKKNYKAVKTKTTRLFRK